MMRSSSNVSSTETSKVRVEPIGIVLEVEPGETVMQAGLRAGLWWPTSCEGDGTCSLCWMDVTEGSEHLTPADDDERATLELVPSVLVKGVPRLACQARVTGDVAIVKKGVRVVAPGQ
jgi:2Fe-2S ferredoxin